MFSFQQNFYPPRLPEGFVLESEQLPSPQELNRLLSKCNQVTHPPARLAKALEHSFCHFSIFEEASGKLYGFVRATSDKGLNANLWNLAVQPGEYQVPLLAVLIHSSLEILRKRMPGCSVSVSAPAIALKTLEDQGFLLDPGGIRVMGFKLR